MSNKAKLRDGAQKANSKLGQVASKPYGLLKILFIGALVVAALVLLAMSLNGANKTDAPATETTTNQ